MCVCLDNPRVRQEPILVCWKGSSPNIFGTPKGCLLHDWCPNHWVFRDQLTHQQTRLSSHSQDLFVPGLLTRTTDRSAGPGKQPETSLTSSPLPLSFLFSPHLLPSPPSFRPVAGHRSLVEEPQLSEGQSYLITFHWQRTGDSSSVRTSSHPPFQWPQRRVL